MEGGGDVSSLSGVGVRVELGDVVVSTSASVVLPSVVVFKESREEGAGEIVGNFSVVLKSLSLTGDNEIVGETVGKVVFVPLRSDNVTLLLLLLVGDSVASSS